MALSLVGGSFLSASLQVLFDRMASREFFDFFKSRKLDHELMKKLNTILISVNGVLDDAEEKQITKHAVKLWLDELKDTVYEADDLLDDIAYEALRMEMEGGSHTKRDQVFSFFPSSFSRLKKGVESKVDSSMSERIEMIVERLEFLLNQKDALGLKEGVGEKPSLNKTPTSCLVDESDVYGRDTDKEAIMKLLQPLDGDGNGNDIDVIPIVGMGGVGKTTLAQLVYNDGRMREWFNLKAWVCVSEEFDVCKVTKDILEAVNGKKCDITTLNLLQVELKEKIAGRRFLLVLDDVWNDKYADWDILRKPLRSGARGSKIIVTTRNESVASIMRTIPTNHHLKELNDDDCWFLFAKHAFDGGSPNEYPNLKVIGKEIVRKCKGLPLAAKTLGGLLRSERDVGEWERISESNMWDLARDDTLPALRLSYHYLPAHLKRCFAYCAIFPKDYFFEKEELVRLWMAEGFLVQSQGNKGLQEIGDEYFHDLVSRSFFQLSSLYQSYFVMHDLINDLAKFVSGEFCFRMEGDNLCEVSNRTRHVSYARLSNDPSKKFEGIIEAKFLRSFLSMDWFRRMDNDNIVKHELLFKLGRLRVLSLSQYDNIVKLPESIGKLKHLRYLDLSKTSIRKLPESICCLYNLETLFLYGCLNLVHLPTNMVKLINMYHLDIGETILQEMPSQMGKLTKLQKLTDFILGKERGSSIKELGKLQFLCGNICIWNLQNVRDAKDALEANLKGKKHLKEIELRWDGETDSSTHDRSVLEQLQPHTNVVGLLIFGYGGTRFPDWIGDSSFVNITSLTLCGCKYCSCLPPLGQLASLKELHISSFEGLVTVGAEFYGSCAPTEKPFRSLQILRFDRMPQWQEWIPYGDEDEGGGFPLLQELNLSDCPSLRKSLPRHLPSLTTLIIRKCEQLVASIPKASPSLVIDLMDDSRDVMLDILPYSGNCLKIDKFHFANSIFEGTEPLGGYSSAVEDVVIGNYDPLTCFPLELFTNLRTISFKNCPNLQSLFALEANGGPFASLIFLEIKKCDNLVAFPDGGLPAPNLTFLSLWNCSRLKSLPDRMHLLLPSLVNLELGNCPELESFPEGGLPSKLQSLVIESCNKLIAGRREWNLQMLPCLSRFRIGREHDVEAFPEEILLPASLASLSIFGFDNLKSLEHRGLQHLNSLVELTVSDCPKLHCFPEEGLPCTLTTLNIWDLQNVESLDCFCLQKLSFLRELEIWNCPNLKSFPEGGLPSTLISLTISNLQNLECLYHKGMQQLVSLKELDILDCPKLQSLPEEGLPSSISSLIIYNCPLLKQRCKQHSGEDWSKISHIPHIQIDSDIEIEKKD